MFKYTLADLKMVWRALSPMKTKKSKSEKIRLTGLALVIICVFASMVLLNANTDFTADDYTYHYIYESPMPSENSKLLSGIGDIPVSMANHYNIWGGRVVAHTIVQFFMLFDKGVFDVFNSLIYVLCGVLIYFHMERDFRKHKWSWLLMIYTAMWFLIPEYGASVLWVSGSCNYLWMLTLILAFLLPYRYGLDRKLGTVWGALAAVAMIPFGFISGCTNENAGGAAAMVAGLLVLDDIIRHKRLRLWSVTGILSAGAGLIFLVAAPGNYERGGDINLSAQVLAQRFDRMIKYTQESMVVPLIILIAAIAAFVFINRCNIKEFFSHMTVPIIYCLAAAANIIVLAATSDFSRRSWILSVFLVIISSGILAGKLRPMKYTALATNCLAAVLAAAYLVSFAAAADSIMQTHREVQTIISQIEEQKAQGIEDVTVTMYKKSRDIHNALGGTANLTPDRRQWFNLWMAKYYDVNSIGIK